MLDKPGKEPFREETLCFLRSIGPKSRFNLSCGKREKLDKKRKEKRKQYEDCGTEEIMFWELIYYVAQPAWMKHIHIEGAKCGFQNVRTQREKWNAHKQNEE